MRKDALHNAKTACRMFGRGARGSRNVRNKGELLRSGEQDSGTCTANFVISNTECNLIDEGSHQILS